MVKPKTKSKGRFPNGTAKITFTLDRKFKQAMQRYADSWGDPDRTPRERLEWMVRYFITDTMREKGVKI